VLAESGALPQGRGRPFEADRHCFSIAIAAVVFTAVLDVDVARSPFLGAGRWPGVCQCRCHQGYSMISDSTRQSDLIRFDFSSSGAEIKCCLVVRAYALRLLPEFQASGMLRCKEKIVIMLDYLQSEMLIIFRG